MALDSIRDADLPMNVARPSAAPPRRGRRLLGWVLAALLAGGLVLALWPSPAPPPPPGPSGPPPILAIGRLVPASRVITIAVPFGGGDARLATLAVEEGDTVAQGATLATLDSADSLRAALATAEAQVAQRAAALAQTRAATAASREEAEAALARAEAALPVLRRDLDRTIALAERGVATRQTLDQRRLAHEQSLQEAASARAALTRYTGPLDAQPDVVLARSNLEAAAAERDRAAADLARAIIQAPSAGTVLTVHTRPGERPGTLGIMTFARLDDMIAEIEVHEDRVGRLRRGAPVTLASPSLETPLQGRLGRVGVEVQRQTLTDPSPAAATDARVVRAVVELDAPSAERAARLVNLQVTARIGP